MKSWWKRQSRKWYSFWDLKAAQTNLQNIGFRESNGETCSQREHREAEEWLLEAQEEYMVARGIGSRNHDS